MPFSRPLAWLASAAVALASAPASAQNLPNDAKCLLVSNLFVKSSDPKARQAANDTRYFYLGRMTGSPEQIQAILVNQGKSVTPQNAGATMQACARAVVQRGREIQAVAQKLSKSEGR